MSKTTEFVRFPSLHVVCVIEALANPDRERMKQSDTNISDWLQSKTILIASLIDMIPALISRTAIVLIKIKLWYC